MNYTSKEVYEFISKQTGDPIVERKTCRISGQPFAIYQSDLDFYERVSPVFNGKKYLIPTPTLCPEERQRRRLSFRNESKLYKRKCDATGNHIISIYSEDKPFKVYANKQWRSDDWSPHEYGRTFDFSKSFGDNFLSLTVSVPKDQLTKEYTLQENADYTNASGPCKNCYMLFETAFSEGSMFGSTVYNSDYCVDCSFIKGCQHCYELIESDNCSNCFYCQNCSQCTYSSYLLNCVGVSHCFQCVNLTSASYCIRNKRYTPDEYERVKHQLTVGKSKEQIASEFTVWTQEHTFFKHQNNVHTESSFGDRISHSSEIVGGYNINESSKNKYCYGVFDAHNCMDINTWGENMHQCLELEQSGRNISNCFFSQLIWTSGKDIYYSNYCIATNSLRGCDGMHRGNTCILNQQYTTLEYEKTVGRIIEHMQETGEWGEFFDPQLSPFGYNETVAMEYFPLTKEEALAKGFNRSDYDNAITIPKGSSPLKGKELPDRIEDVDDSILNKIIVCEVSGKPFRIIKQELEFYRKHDIPLPRKHPDVRHQERLQKRPGRTLYLRTCDKCGEEMVSVYAPKSRKQKGEHGNPHKVYCEACYQSEVYG